MKVGEAIKKLEEYYPGCTLDLHPGFMAALRLGVKALGYIRDHPETWDEFSKAVLPGEPEPEKEG